VDNMIPPLASIFFDYLQFQIGMSRIDAAEQTWARLLALNLPFDIHQAGPYLDGLIRHRRVAALKEAWSALASRFPGQISAGVSRDNLITNGSFEFEVLNEGLDWRVTPAKGAAVSLDSTNAFDGVRSLRIEFDGTGNLNYGGALQYVPVQPNSRYKFTAYMRASAITTDSGPRMQVFDAYDMGKLFLSTEGILGNSGWSAQQVGFRTGPDTQLLIVRLARPASRKFDNLIAGTVWIDCVSLTPERERVK
jgi:Carbohydrate binding domain